VRLEADLSAFKQHVRETLHDALSQLLELLRYN
jgi:hypothetical protein